MKRYFTRLNPIKPSDRLAILERHQGQWRILYPFRSESYAKVHLLPQLWEAELVLDTFNFVEISSEEAHTILLRPD